MQKNKLLHTLTGAWSCRQSTVNQYEDCGRQCVKLPLCRAAPLWMCTGVDAIICSTPLPAAHINTEKMWWRWLGGGGGWYLRWSVSVSISPGLKGRKERRQIALCGGGSVRRFLVAGNRRGVCYCTRGSILIISPMQRTHGHISLLSARTYRRTRPLMSHNKQPSI